MTTDPVQPQDIKVRKPSFLTLIALTGALALLSSTMAKTPALPLFARALNGSPTLIGWTVMASTIPGILVSLPAGFLSDRLGTRPLLLAALFVFATAPFLYLLVHTIDQLALVRFYHGFATAIFGTVISAEIVARYPTNRGHALGMYSAISTAGRSIAPFLGGLLISTSGFSGVYLACAAAGVLAFALGLKTTSDLPVPSGVKNTVMLKNLAAVLTDRLVIITSIVEALQYLVFGSVEAFLAIYTAHNGWAAWRIGLLLGAQLGVVVLLKPRLGQLSDRKGRRLIILWGLGLGTVAVAALPFTDAFIPLLFLNILFGIGFAATTTATSALVGDRGRAGGFGASMGVLRSIMDVGQAIGPVLTGFLVQYQGYRVAFITLACLLAAAGILFMTKTSSTQSI